MQYGVRPEGMSDEAWTIECQNRHVARLASQASGKRERVAILQKWQQILPEVSRDRVVEIWRQGVPMPTTRGRG